MKSLLCFYKTWVQQRLRFFDFINTILRLSYTVFQNILSVFRGQTVDSRNHWDNLVFTLKKSSEILSVELNFILIHKTQSFYFVELIHLLIQFLPITQFLKLFITSLILFKLVILLRSFFNLLIFLLFLHLHLSFLLLFFVNLILNVLMSVSFFVSFSFFFDVFNR